MNSTSIKIAISAGELSGDQHAAELVSELQAQFKDQQLEIAGMGGKNLQNAGMKIIVDANKSGSINGFNLFRIFTSGLLSLIRMIIFIFRFKPQALILVDYPDFNLRLARFAKLFGIKTFYFIPSKIWAWRQNRSKLFKKYIDHTFVIFPFEAKFYQDQGYQQVSFVGHPFTTKFSNQIGEHYKNRESFLRSLGLVPSYPTLAILPGSRTTEVKRHLKTITQSLLSIKKENSEIQAVIAVAPSINPRKIEKMFAKYDWIKVAKVSSHDVMENCDAGLLKSGTCNLEATFFNLPFVCFYKVSGLAAWIVKKFVKIKQYSLVNIIKPQTVKELMQEDFTAEKIGAEVNQLIYNEKYRGKMLEDFKAIRENLSTNNDQHSAYCEAAQKISRQIENKRPISLLQRLLQSLKPYRKQFYVALGCMAIFGATDGTLPLLVKHFLDDVFASQNQNMLYLLPVLLFILSLVRAASGFTQSFLMARIGHNIVKDFRNHLHSHLLKLNPDYYSSNSSGNILARFTSDVILVREFLTNSTAAIIRDTIRIIALIIVAFYLDTTLALIAFLAFPIGIIPVHYLGKKIRKLSKKGQDEIGSISSLIHETIQGNRVIKIFNQEQREQSKFEDSNLELTKTFVKSEKNRALSTPINEVLAVLAICAVIWYGGHSVIAGVRSQGEFIAFLVSIFLLYDPFKKISRVYHQMQQGASGAERIYELLDQEPSIIEPSNPKDFPNSYQIEFKNVHFAYPNSNAIALNNINLTVQENQKVALVGFSGSGKSTLVDLLPRFIDPVEGDITIGGTKLKELSLIDIRNHIAMVNQQTFLFNDTIYNNIAYGKPDATKEQIESAAQSAYAHEFILALPEGYQTIVGEDGTKLSGGERQRIAIARAILKDCPILVLDEATAALDNKSENEVQKAIEKLESGKTAIVIAHRLSTVRNADKIIVMDKGEVVEIGTHNELLNQGGVYLRLHELQFASNP